MVTKSKVPQIRFNSFFEKWEENELGNKIEFFSGLTYSPNDVIKQNGTLVLRSSNVKNGIIVNADNVYVNSKVVNCDNVQKGDIAVVVRNGSRSLIGKHAQIQKEMKNTVIGAFMTGVRSEQPSFLNTLLDSPKFNKEIEKNLGATINQITTGSFKKMIFSFPKEDEQTKIGDYFHQLDKLIEQKEKKHEKLKQFKKAMLDKMFPKNGANTPEIRFKSFSGKWEEHYLGELCKVAKSGGTPLSTNKEYYNGTILFLSISDMTTQGKYLTYTNKRISKNAIDSSAAWLVPKNTIIYSMYASVGFVSINKIPLTTSQAVINLILKDDIYTEYIYYYLSFYKKNIHEFIETGTQGNLNAETVKSLIVKLPTKTEQEKIGNYFQKLDKQIDLQIKEIKKLKNIKKASLNKMFV